ncbi:unnamed protein product, partial [Brachionus calyciflorus]
IKCRTGLNLEDNFENLVTLSVESIKKLKPGCFNKLKGIKNLLLVFSYNRNIGYIDSTYFDTLDNLDYLYTKTDFYSSIDDIGLERGEYFVQLFDKRKKLNKKIDSLVKISNEEAIIDVFSELSNDTKEAINVSKEAFKNYN